jgi:hypothetical protein
MRKRLEMIEPNSCLNKAGDQEMVFVLLGRDESAPAAIRAWCDDRLVRGKNKATDPQIVEAFECADTMERERPLGVRNCEPTYPYQL